MRYQRFDELPVWRAAIDLGRRVYGLTGNEAFRGRHSLRDQIERAAVSVSNNIAEGFERGTNQELLTFLYIARGSAGEVLFMLFLLEGMEPFRNLESKIRNLKAATESVSRQLGAWIRSLKDSELKGQRYVNQEDAPAQSACARARGILERIGKNSQTPVLGPRPGIRNSESAGIHNSRSRIR